MEKSATGDMKQQRELKWHFIFFYLVGLFSRWDLCFEGLSRSG